MGRSRMKLPNIDSLYGRIFTIFWLTQLLVLLTVLVLQQLDPRQMSDIPSNLQVKMNALADEISQQIAPLSGTINQKLLKVVKESSSHRHGMRWFFTSTDGEFISRMRHHERPIRNFITLSDDLTLPQRRLYGKRMLLGPFLIEDRQMKAHLYVSIPWKRALPFYVQLLDRPFQLLFVTMLISTPLLLWLAWAVTRPARRLQSAADRVCAGCFETDILLEKGPKEFRRAGESFNQMVTSINQMLSGQQTLLSNISHELRSPLTRLRMANALASRKQGQSRELDRIDIEAARMEQMIADLLALSRMQMDSHVERSRYLIQTLWQPLLNDAQFEASQLGKSLHYSTLPPVSLTGNAPLLASALENVVRNAIRYAKQRIEVSFVCTHQTLCVSIQDDGDGVPEAMLKDIFRPFFRVSAARDRETGGTGLGLAITENAMHQHQGSVQAHQNAQGGLTVVLIFALRYDDLKTSE